MILVIGLGRMGRAVADILEAWGYNVEGVDTLAEAKGMKPATVFACVPYHAVMAVAEYAATIGADYTDLTEDVGVRDAIEVMGSKALVISGSGLAPGYINMVAGRLHRLTANPRSVEMFCGALPQDPYCNAYGYQVSWSASGLVRECTAPCEIKVHGDVVSHPAMQGLQQVAFTGWPAMEAFYTSGGAGTTPHTLTARTVTYKTLRYPGHRDWFAPLLRRPDPEAAVTEACGPLTGDDIVYLAVRVRGESGDLLHTERILPCDGYTAIQYATAMGAIRVWEAAIDRTGFVRPEQL